MDKPKLPDEWAQHFKVTGPMASPQQELDALKAEVEGDNGLRASKDAGWALARSRLKALTALQQRTNQLEFAANMLLQYVKTVRDDLISHNEEYALETGDCGCCALEEDEDGNPQHDDEDEGCRFMGWIRDLTAAIDQYKQQRKVDTK